ncbi:MAG TPA: hypothetical protein PKA90_02320 [Ignavibacteria bacterium]|nr:hypothetical protein [Ignavibacteria bacterium]HMR39243.1 hypothetical protein [Ignavibacteria bacterium]
MKVKKNNKFFTIFKTLSETEKKEFCEFLRLSFIKRPRLSEFIIEKIYNGEDLHKYLDDKYSERSIWNIYSELTRTIGEFLALKEVTGNEKKMHDLKRNQLSKRGLRKLLFFEYKNEVRDLISSEFYFFKFKDIHNSAYLYMLELIKNGLSDRFHTVHEMNSDYKNLAFILEILSSNIEDKFRKEFYENKAELLQDKIITHIDLNRIIDIISSKYPEYNELFRLLYDMNCSVNDPADYKLFKILKNKILNNVSNFSKSFSSDIYIALINLCNIVSNRSKKDTSADLFGILKSKIENGFIEDLQQLKIGENHFRDYIYAALQVKEDKWAEDFLTEYSRFLPSSIKENNVNTAYAFISYYRKNYQDAIDHIKKVKSNFYIHNLDFYSIQIFSYFDLGNIVECMIIKKRFQEYVNKNSQLTDINRKGVMNFLKILTYLLSYKETGKKNILHDLKYAFANSNELHWKNWLTDKINELEISNQ